MVKGAQEEEFNWQQLSNYAASAANMLRAFEYAGDVFNAVAAGESKLAIVDEKVTEVNKKIEEYNVTLIELVKKIAGTKEQAASDIKAQSDLAKTRYEKDFQTRSNILLGLDNKIDSKQRELDSLIENFNARKRELNLSLETITNKLVKATEEYDAFLAKLSKA